MGRINIELPDELHTKLKMETVRRDITLREYVKNVLSDELEVELEENE